MNLPRLYVISPRRCERLTPDVPFENRPILGGFFESPEGFVVSRRAPVLEADEGPRGGL